MRQLFCHFEPRAGAQVVLVVKNTRGGVKCARVFGLGVDSVPDMAAEIEAHAQAAGITSVDLVAPFVTSWAGAFTLRQRLARVLAEIREAVA